MIIETVDLITARQPQLSLRQYPPLTLVLRLTQHKHDIIPASGLSEKHKSVQSPFCYQFEAQDCDIAYDKRPR